MLFYFIFILLFLPYFRARSFAYPLSFTREKQMETIFSLLKQKQQHRKKNHTKQNRKSTETVEKIYLCREREGGVGAKHTLALPHSLP